MGIKRAEAIARFPEFMPGDKVIAIAQARDQLGSNQCSVSKGATCMVSELIFNGYTWLFSVRGSSAVFPVDSFRRLLPDKQHYEPVLQATATTPFKAGDSVKLKSDSALWERKSVPPLTVFTVLECCQTVIPQRQNGNTYFSVIRVATDSVSGGNRDIPLIDMLEFFCADEFELVQEAAAEPKDTKEPVVIRYVKDVSYNMISGLVVEHGTFTLPQ